MATARGGCLWQKLGQAPAGHRSPEKLLEGFREGIGCGLKKVRPQVLSNVTEVQDHKHPAFTYPPTRHRLPCVPCDVAVSCVCSGGVTWAAPTDSLGGCENQRLALAPALPEGSQQFQSIPSAQLSLARFQQSFA